jgi:four helix bundle protein
MNNAEFKVELELRTKRFAVSLINFLAELPHSKVLSVIVNQLTKSGTSIGANYREANRAESKRDFIHKIGIVEKEASETVYWMELLKESKLLTEAQRTDLTPLSEESKELLALFTSISRSSRNSGAVR